MTKRQMHKRRGAAMVEMALVLPVFMMTVFGIIEFGRAMMVGQLVTNAAREAARVAVVGGSNNTAVITQVKDFLASTTGVAQGDVTVTVTVTPYTGNPDPGNQIANANSRDLCTVTVLLPFAKVSLLHPTYLQTTSLRGSSSMRFE